MTHAHHKIAGDHLRRTACLYVRQSTPRQVLENTESTRRQYALRERAAALGWTTEAITVIDTDLGRSGAYRDREGFQKLVAEVGMGRVGIVLGLEVSRLARNNADWQSLLEICAVTATLVLDEDGIYDPTDFNDRLLLGLKGVLSEAEMHMLKSRLWGGTLNKARRGELKVPLPVGLAYDPLDRVVLDPDAQVQSSIRILFDTFARTGSASATVKHFRQENLLFPRRLRGGPCKGDLVWQPLTLWRVLQILHNPRYAGAFVFGRSKTRRRPDGGSSSRRVPREDWLVLLKDAHVAYISWERLEANQQQLRENGRGHGPDRRRSPPREGPALLQGLALCGVCGSRMTVRYNVRKQVQVPIYLCQRDLTSTGGPICQRIPGTGIDAAIGALLVELVTPATLEVALGVQDELKARAREAGMWRAQKVQRAREEVDLARLRYMGADPLNRMVVDVLEAEWNARLRALDDAQQEFDRQSAEDNRELADEKRREIHALATDFPRLWSDPATPDRERKRMARLLIEDVTITRGEEIALGVRLRGGATRQMTLPLELQPWKRYQTSGKALDDMNKLLDHHPEAEVAEILNRDGHRTGYGGRFHVTRVQSLCRDHGLKFHYQRLRERGLLTVSEIAERLEVTAATVKKWRRDGLLRGHVVNGRNECLYEMPDNRPVKNRHKRKTPGSPDPGTSSDRTKEVQYEA